MNNKEQIFEDSSLYTKISYKVLFTILFFTSISLFLILFSFDPEDTGWGVFSENTAKNLYGKTGAYLSGLIIREFGLLPGLLLSSLLFIWSLKFFNGAKIKFFKIRFLSIFLMVFFSALGGSYFETQLIQKLNINFPIISQNGLSEWFLVNFTNKVSELIKINDEILSLVLGTTSAIISWHYLFGHHQ